MLPIRCSKDTGVTYLSPTMIDVDLKATVSRQNALLGVRHCSRYPLPPTAKRHQYSKQHACVQRHRPYTSEQRKLCTPLGQSTGEAVPVRSCARILQAWTVPLTLHF